MLAMLSQPQEPFGQRLLVSMIDSRATKEPNAPWVSIPKNDNDVTLGYKDVSYSQLSNAVNRAAAWLKASLPPANNSFLPFAYAGAHDLRYPILAIAAAKLGYVVSTVYKYRGTSRTMKIDETTPDSASIDIHHSCGSIENHESKRLHNFATCKHVSRCC